MLNLQLVLFWKNSGKKSPIWFFSRSTIPKPFIPGVSIILVPKFISNNYLKKKFDLVDARSKDRFIGITPDPRKNVRSGSIPNSICLPFKTLINDDFTFKSKSEISSYFKDLSLNDPVNVVFSCGSGITACVLALAYSQVNNKYLPVIYDGSWAEYGKI